MTAGRDFTARVRSAMIWRSGTQIIAQLIAWGSTLALVRILDPQDYGMFAMTQVVLAGLSFLNGYGLASSIIQAEQVEPIRVRQAFGALLLLNASIAGIQLVLAPTVAQFYHHPIIADLLRVQALIFLATPFIVLSEALLARSMEFRKTALVNLLSAVVGAITGLACALQGLGVWTLVFAALSIFWTQAIGLVIAARLYIWPSFDFRGTGQMFSFGATVLLSHIFWTVQSQSDIFIAGRILSSHDLGLFAEALFLTTIFAAKFVPPLNEVAFPAYARLQTDPSALRWSFLKAVRLIMLFSCPVYAGMAITAPELVEVVLGQKWAGMAPLVAILALAMPVMTLQILFAPVNNALGRPQINVRVSMFGAVLMPLTFLVSVGYGTQGLAWGWVIAFPLLTAFTFAQSHRHIGISAADVARAIWPGLSTSLAMAAVVWVAEPYLLARPVYARLAALVAIGGITYGLLLFVLAKPTLEEIFRLIIQRKPPASDPKSGFSGANFQQ